MSDCKNPKPVEIEIRKNKIHLSFIGAPIAPVKAALKKNGFKNKNSIYIADITPENAFFVRLLTGVRI